jgi:phage tail tape-measure protein
MPEGEISMEDLIAIEQVARKLWEQTTKGTATEWDALSVLAKQALEQHVRMITSGTFQRQSAGAGGLAPLQAGALEAVCEQRGWQPSPSTTIQAFPTARAGTNSQDSTTRCKTPADDTTCCARGPLTG